jgi:hypothetical protein
MCLSWWFLLGTEHSFTVRGKSVGPLGGTEGKHLMTSDVWMKHSSWFATLHDAWVIGMKSAWIWNVLLYNRGWPGWESRQLLRRAQEFQLLPTGLANWDEDGSALTDLIDPNEECPKSNIEDDPETVAQLERMGDQSGPKAMVVEYDCHFGTILEVRDMEIQFWESFAPAKIPQPPTRANIHASLQHRLAERSPIGPLPEECQYCSRSWTRNVTGREELDETRLSRDTSWEQQSVGARKCLRSGMLKVSASSG